MRYTVNGLTYILLPLAGGREFAYIYRNRQFCYTVHLVIHRPNGRVSRVGKQETDSWSKALALASWMQRH